MFIDFSINEVREKVVNSTKRFPWVMTILTLCTALSCLLIYDKDFFGTPDQTQPILKLIALLVLGIPLSIGVSIFKEYHFSKKIHFDFDVALILTFILGGIYFLLPGFDKNNFFYKYVHLSFIFHLFVSLAPFINIKKNQNLEFWSYNYLVLNRILKSGIYALTFWVGISLAILAINLLFGTKLEKAFGYLAIFSFMFFQTIYFISGLPKKSQDLTSDFVYPNELRLFTQFALIPISSLFLVILYAYMFKIVIQWKLPGGYIGWLVTSISILGAFTLLFIHPLRQSPKYKWINLFWKSYFVLILPLLGLLFFALFIRISDYGLTESRILLFMSGLSLLGLSLYFIFVKNENIKWIPFSLMTLALIIFMGPLSAYRLSYNSQTNRALGLITKNKIKDLKSLEKTLPKDAGDLSSILRYLNRNNKEKTNRFLNQNFAWANTLTDIKSEPSNLNVLNFLETELNKIKYNNPQSNDSGQYYSFSNKDQSPKSLNNAKSFVSVYIGYSNETNTIKINNEDWTLKAEAEALVFKKEMASKPDAENTETFKISLADLFKQATQIYKNEKGNLPTQHTIYPFKYTSKSLSIDGFLYIGRVDLSTYPTTKGINSLNGILFFN